MVNISLRRPEETREDKLVRRELWDRIAKVKRYRICVLWQEDPSKFGKWSTIWSRYLYRFRRIWKKNHGARVWHVKRLRCRARDNWDHYGCYDYIWNHYGDYRHAWNRACNNVDRPRRLILLKNHIAYSIHLSESSRLGRRLLSRSW